MKLAVFHGSPRRGNTYRATELFLDELSRLGDVEISEFYLPEALPKFCVGCQLCLSGPRENCPHSKYVDPIYEAIMAADALVFTTPHYGACSMSAGMKNLLDHLDFLTMNIAPRREIFVKRAFIITTASGSTAAIAPIRKYLKNWGVNRVGSLGIRMLTNEWNAMPPAKQARTERRLRHCAARFYTAKRGLPYISTAFMYYMSVFILKRFVGEDTYPHKFWTENGYFTRRPF